MLVTPQATSQCACYVNQPPAAQKQVAATNAAWSIDWTFDTWSNRLTQTPAGLATTRVGSQTLGYVNNRLTTYTYDAAGNQTNDGLHNYGFDAQNKIKQMDGGAATYAYDGEGRRMQKVVGTEATYFFYALGSLVCEFTTTNTGAGQAGSTDRLQYETNKLGSVELIMSGSLVTENNRTLPYGELWNSQVGSVNQRKFTTYQRDQESGLDYAMNRYNSNTYGRFTSVDKGDMALFAPVALNRYVYAAADPVNHTDPDGNIISTITPPPLPPFPQPGDATLSGRGEWEPIWVRLAEARQAAKDRRDKRQLGDPVCDQPVIDAMKNAFRLTANGTSGTEAAFVLVRRGVGGYNVVNIGYTNERGQVNFRIPANTFAIFHVHPNNSLPQPSAVVIDLAKRLNLQMFTFGNGGLWEFDKNLNVTNKGPQPMRLAERLDWTKPCPQ
jgi:RHS repeat-associated protein